VALSNVSASSTTTRRSSMSCAVSGFWVDIYVLLVCTYGHRTPPRSQRNSGFVSVAKRLGGPGRLC
jgi:hypothetical protein